MFQSFLCILCCFFFKDTRKTFGGPSARQIVQDQLKSKLAIDDFQKNWHVFVLFKEVPFKEKCLALVQVCASN